MGAPSSKAKNSADAKHQTHAVSNNENKESTTLIWFDPNIDLREDTQLTKTRLREINDYVVFHTELEQCIKSIKSIDKEKIFLITSGSLCSQLLTAIGTYRQLDSVFIFCMKKTRYENLTSEYPNIVGIYTTVDELCASLREQIDLIDQQLQTFSFYNQHQKCIRDLSKESAEFLWFQLFNDVISRLPRNQQAKQQMLDVCRQYYRGNLKQEIFINKFERTYQPEEAIHWYSKQSFVYKMVNKALRTEDIDQLHIFRFFIGDLSENLAREHRKIVVSNERILNVYRGMKLSNEELDKLKKNKEKLISTNSYFSTSRRRSEALIFATKPTKRSDAMPVLFEIECDIQALGESVIFADIANFSSYPDEEEVLFDLGATFRIDSVQNETQVWLIKMKATTEGLAVIQCYVKETRRETEERSVAIMFGRLLCNMGQYQKSEKYFGQLLIDPNGEDLAWIEHNMGRVLQFKGDWKTAREYFDHAYDRMMKVDPPRIRDSAYVLNNIGSILHNQKKYDEALGFHRRALAIREKYHSSSHIDIAHSLNNIGNILSDQGKFNQALDFHRRALEIRQIYYSDAHVDIAQSLNNIGTILRSQEKYEEALEYHLQALTIREKSYPADHVDIAHSLNNIGNILGDLEKYDEALDFHRRALLMREKCYSAAHVDIAQSLANIGVILHKQHKYNEARHFFQRAFATKEEHYATGDLGADDTPTDINLILKTYDNRQNQACNLQ